MQLDAQLSVCGFETDKEEPYSHQGQKAKCPWLRLRICNRTTPRRPKQPRLRLNAASSACGFAEEQQTLVSKQTGNAFAELHARMGMEFRFRRPNKTDIKSIATWQYEPPYTKYNGQRFVFSFWMLVWFPWLFPLYDYYVVDDAHDNLVGFFTFYKLPERKILVGLGLRPDRTGQGLGLAFVQAGLAFAKDRYAPVSFHLRVAPFNKRAIKVYMRAGFKRVTNTPIEKRGLWSMRCDA